MAGLKEIFL